jgi:hypothetical protein
VRPNLQKITGAGQLAVGDRIIITNKQGEQQKATVRIVLDGGTDREEIVFNKTRNYYFILSMMLTGTSWAKECHKVIEQPTEQMYMKDNLSVIIHGPQGCGKSTNSQRLAELFGLKTVVDDWTPGSKVSSRGVLYLTSERLGRHTGAVVIDYESALRRMNVASQPAQGQRDE